MTKVGQLNLHKAKGASHLTAKKFIKEQFGVMLLQEPWVNQGKICGLATPQTELVYDNNEPRPRACILIDRKLNYTTLTEFLSMDLVAVEVNTASEPKLSVVIASAYFPGDDREAPPQWDPEACGVLQGEEEGTHRRLRRKRPQRGVG